MASGIDSATGELETGRNVGPQLFRRLRERILNGELAPGTRLSEAEIAVAYGTSRQPVREAFIKLAEAALIEVRPQRGSYVSRIDIDAVMAAQFVREAVETSIVRRIAATATPDDLADLDAMLAAQDEVAGLPDPQPFMALDEAFHRRLAEIAGQARGWDYLQPLKTQMDRVRNLSARTFPRPALVGQHRDIVRAIGRSDADAAEAHMRDHLRRILEDLPAVAEALPDHFGRAGR
ncbi:GntR family transcriptional regulator [Jannaschia rubra]|uniref:Putative HTH-type transcriptional regulator YdfH n=1 Tax=Jannaschia rubra TaxID=282197 RepID=A0A0M6XSL0_9RHOB|nr:GntR family transcriptional regulator [Jannaschia rubra]CTQ33165.1 putative HTH-type transcriptional regulator YdfH [Jannaschia rubra]SFG79913.1 DNA-binding transcriptional regulator, GntR family [Jannaschia rubra]